MQFEESDLGLAANRLRKLVLIVTFGLALFSCSDKGTNPIELFYWGITVTDETGEVLSVDPDDWGCSEPVVQPPDTTTPQGNLPTSYCFDPAYPNPCKDVTRLRFAVPVRSQVIITVSDGLSYLDTICVGVYPAGQYALIWDARGLRNWTYRIAMQAGDWTCHGDVRVQN